MVTENCCITMGHSIHLGWRPLVPAYLNLRRSFIKPNEYFLYFCKFSKFFKVFIFIRYLKNKFCRSCRDKEETVLHLLGTCPALCKRTKRYLGAYYTDDLSDMLNIDFRSLSRFIVSSMDGERELLYHNGPWDGHLYLPTYISDVHLTSQMNIFFTFASFQSFSKFSFS